MSEFKFACPVCGQHITCDSGSSGSAMACPTCFRQLVVPQASADGGSNLVLNAAEVQSRTTPLPGNGGAEAGRVTPVRSFPWAALVLGAVVCTAAAAAFVFRGKIFSMLPKGERVATNALPSAAEPVVTLAGLGTNWTLNLAAATIPDAPVAGQINGQTFAVQRATLRGGMLILWQGAKWPPEAGMAVDFFAKQAEELAGKTIIIEAAHTNAPHLMVRWKDEQGQSVTQEFHDGYALRVEFGELAGTRLPGKIYLAAPDDGKSYLAGTFEAEIHKPSPRKPKPQP
jgi:hypothetical protein